MSETWRKSSDRFHRHNRLVTAKNRPRPFINTPFGNKLTGDYLEPIANFLAGKHPRMQADGISISRIHGCPVNHDRH